MDALHLLSILFFSGNIFEKVFLLMSFLEKKEAVDGGILENI